MMEELKGIEELKKLLGTKGISGYEGPIRNTIKEMVSELGETREDNIGNLILEKPGDGPHIAVVAHMDEIGLVVSNIEDNGYLRIMKIGGVKDSLLEGRPVTIHTEAGPVNGIIGHKAPHLKTSSDEEEKITPWTKTRVDIGASSKEEARKMGVDVPNPITFNSTFRRMGDKRFSSGSLDNRIGCYTLIRVARQLMTQDTNKRYSFVWSVQEEIGLRGAKVVANTLNPDYVIALDTYTTTDSPGIESFYKPIKLGSGPVIRMVDTRAISSPKMVEHFKNVAERNGIPYQYGVTGGTTDGMALQEGGGMMAALGVPVRYSHSTVECGHWGDVNNLYNLVAKGVSELPL
ncbi:MAG: M42 family metallopeptidase [Thermoplasmata archaeon]